MVRIFSSKNEARAGFSTAFVSWYRYDLFPKLPPLTMNRHSWGAPVGEYSLSAPHEESHHPVTSTLRSGGWLRRASA